MLLGKSLEYVVCTAVLMNELVFITTFLKVCVFVNKTFYNVYPMFITSSLANWITYCTES